MKGHIRERSPGHWAIVLDVHDPQTGKRRRRWYSFVGTKRAAQIRCAELVAAAQQGTSIDASQISVAEFVDRFDRDWNLVHVPVLTAERYRDVLKHFRRRLGERRLQKLQAADLAAHYAHLFREGKAPSTIRLHHRVVHRALGQAETWGLVRGNIANVVKPPKAPNRETEM